MYSKSTNTKSQPFLNQDKERILLNLIEEWKESDKRRQKVINTYKELEKIINNKQETEHKIDLLIKAKGDSSCTLKEVKESRKSASKATLSSVTTVKSSVASFSKRSPKMSTSSLQKKQSVSSVKSKGGLLGDEDLARTRIEKFHIMVEKITGTDRVSPEEKEFLELLGKYSPKRFSTSSNTNIT